MPPLDGVQLEDPPAWWCCIDQAVTGPLQDLHVIFKYYYNLLQGTNCLGHISDVVCAHCTLQAHCMTITLHNQSCMDDEAAG